MIPPVGLSLGTRANRGQERKPFPLLPNDRLENERLEAVPHLAEVLAFRCGRSAELLGGFRWGLLKPASMGRTRLDRQQAVLEVQPAGCGANFAAQPETALGGRRVPGAAGRATSSLRIPHNKFALAILESRRPGTFSKCGARQGQRSCPR